MLLVGWRRRLVPDGVLQARLPPPPPSPLPLGPHASSLLVFSLPLGVVSSLRQELGRAPEERALGSVKPAASLSSGAAAAFEIKSGVFELRDTCWT